MTAALFVFNSYSEIALILHGNQANPRRRLPRKIGELLTTQLDAATILLCVLCGSLKPELYLNQ